MAAKIYCVAIQKGGCMKSGLVASILAELTNRNHKVLAVDIDPQCNLTHYMEAKSKIKTLDVLLGKANIAEAIVKVKYGYILSGDRELYNYSQKDLPIEALKTSLNKVKEYFDYIIIDTPPNLGVLTNNAIFAADEVIIPTPIGDFCLDAVDNMINTIYTLKSILHLDVKIAGILFTRIKTRSVLTRTMVSEFEELATRQQVKIFNTRIRECQAIQDSQYVKQSVFEYSPNCNASKDLRKFLNELLEIEQNKEGAKLL